MFHRRRRVTRMAPVIQSFKKVMNDAPASRAAGATIDLKMSDGEDSVAAGQTGPIDAGVPTGSLIKFFEIQYCVTNLVAISLFMHVSIQLIRSGQTNIAPNVVGGNPQRNQVFYQKLYSVGKEQNSTLIVRFKVPKRFQRVRDGDTWQFVRTGSAVYTDATQVIYKFYR